MKMFKLDELYVIKTEDNNEITYKICKKNNLFQTYIDVLTEEKIKSYFLIEPLSKYFNIDEKFDHKTGKYVKLSKKDILKKYKEINELNKKIKESIAKEQKVNESKRIEKLDVKDN